jgi:hypothetical protein
MFADLKDYRRLATQYDYWPKDFLSTLAATIIFCP